MLESKMEGAATLFPPRVALERDDFAPGKEASPHPSVLRLATAATLLNRNIVLTP